jgi:pilus assembly protein Flp/PilA
MLNLFPFLYGFLTQRLRQDDRGVTSVEYALLATLIAVVIIAGATALGLAINGQLLAIAGNI